MSLMEKQVAVGSVPGGTEQQHWPVEATVRAPGQSPATRSPARDADKTRDLRSVIATVVTTLAVFGIYTLQGAMIARILGAEGRGEFGTAIFFPRDIFLWAGLLGGIEIVNSYARRGVANSVSLKYSAARLGLISGLITAAVAATASIGALLFFVPEKSYLIPMCLLCCLFVPLEHMHLTISAVDRGTESYSRYNVNRLLFALAFPALVAIAFFVLRLPELTGLGMVNVMCIVFVVSRILGLLPTLRGMSIAAMFRALFGSSSENGSRTEHELPAEAIQASSAEPIVVQSDAAIPNARKLLSEGRTYALSMIATEIFERLDVLLIVICASMADSGFYFVAVPAAALLTIVPNALGVFTFNAGAAGRRVTVKEAVGVMAGLIALQIVATLIFMLILPWLIVWLNSDKFAGSILFAMWLLPASAIKGYLQAVDGYLKGRGKPMIGVWSRVISIFAMIGFVLTYSSLGLVCIPMAACVGQALSMLIISVAVIHDVSQQNSIDANNSGASGSGGSPDVAGVAG